MEDRRYQIPIGCSVNVAIMAQFQSTDVFRQKCIQVPSMMGIQPSVPGEPWPFFNLSWGAYLLYCLIVVPKELYNLPNEDEFYARLEKENVMESFTVKKEIKSFQDDPHRPHHNPGTQVRTGSDNNRQRACDILPAQTVQNRVYKA